MGGSPLSGPMECFGARWLTIDSTIFYELKFAIGLKLVGVLRRIALESNALNP